MTPNSYRVFFSVLTAISLNGCAGLDNPITPKQMLSRQILVTLPDRLKADWTPIKQELAKTHTMTETGDFPLSSIGVNCLVYKVPEQQSLTQVISALKADQRVGLVQENQVFEGIQGGESDDFAALSYGPKLTHADAAHPLTTGKGVKVAIIDTGAEKDHPDLKGRFLKTANFVEGGEGSFTRDKHGTAVAGVIGAKANDNNGIYGIAPDAQLSLFKACWYPEQGNKAQCSSWSLAKALDAAINQSNQIINLSLAGPQDELMAMLLQKAHSKNIHIVAATQENKPAPGFPAELPFVIPVIATGPDGKPQTPTWLQQFPNTIAAPGLDILTTIPKEGYDFVSGSSLATAHVSGLIALLLERQPDLQSSQIQALMAQYQNKESGASVPDVCAMLKALNQSGC